MLKPSVNLDELLSTAAGEITIGGAKYDVMPVTAIDYQLLQSTDWGSGELAPICDMIKRLVPSLSDELHAKLTLPAMAKIIRIAQGLVDAVEADLPNSSAPATTNSPRPARKRKSRGG